MRFQKILGSEEYRIKSGGRDKFKPKEEKNEPDQMETEEINDLDK